MPIVRQASDKIGSTQFCNPAMAKGFGTQPDRQLGYVLNLMPEVNAYAGKFSLEFRGEKGPFIGIVGDLESAQVWPRLKQAEAAIATYYGDFLVDQLKESPEVKVSLQKLKRSADGTLKTTVAKILVVSAETLKG